MYLWNCLDPSLSGVCHRNSGSKWKLHWDCFLFFVNIYFLCIYLLFFSSQVDNGYRSIRLQFHSCIPFPKPLNHTSQSREEPSHRKSKENQVGSTLSQLSFPVHASLTEGILQRKWLTLWHMHHLWNKQGIRICVQISTSLVE